MNKSGASVNFATSPSPAITSTSSPIRPVDTSHTAADADPTTTASHDGMDARASDNGSAGEEKKKKVKPLLFGRDAEEVIPLAVAHISSLI